MAVHILAPLKHDETKKEYNSKRVKINNNDYTQTGLTKGTIEIAKSDYQVDVGLFVSDGKWPTWIHALGPCGFKGLRITSSKHLPCLKLLHKYEPELKFLHLSKESISYKDKRIKLLLCEGNSPLFSSFLWSLPTLQYIVVGSAPKHLKGYVQQGWFFCGYKWNHFSLGGVTTLKGFFGIFSRTQIL